MNAQVDLETRTLSETFPTHSTVIRFLPGVDAQVLLEVTLAGEALCTQ